MFHLSTAVVIAALFLVGLGHAHDLVAASDQNPYFLFDVRTSTLSSRDVLSQGIAKCLDLDAVSSVPFRSYTTHSLDDSTVVTIQFDEEKYAISMLQYISTANSTDAAKVCLHDQCNNLIINTIVASYDPPGGVPANNDGSNFFSSHPYVFVGAGAGVLMLLIVTIVVIIKRKEKREKDEYVEPLSTMEQGRVGPHPRQRQANDVDRPGRPVVHQAKVVISPTPNASPITPHPTQQLPEAAPQQQEVAPPPAAHNRDASLN